MLAGDVASPVQVQAPSSRLQSPKCLEHTDTSLPKSARSNRRAMRRCPVPKLTMHGVCVLCVQASTRTVLLRTQQRRTGRQLSTSTLRESSYAARYTSAPELLYCTRQCFYLCPAVQHALMCHRVCSLLLHPPHLNPHQEHMLMLCCRPRLSTCWLRGVGRSLTPPAWRHCWYRTHRSRQHTTHQRQQVGQDDTS